MEPEPLEYTSEDSLVQAQIALKEDEFNSKCEPPNWLVEAESVFKWLISFPKKLIYFQTNYFQAKVLYREKEGLYFAFPRYVSLLTFLTMKTLEWYNLEVDLFQGNHVCNNEDKPVDTVEEYTMEEAYMKCKEALEEMAADGDVLYRRIGPALLHVLQATRAHMLYLQGNVSQSQETAKHIQPAVEMPPECQAAFIGIKTSILLDISKDDEKTLEISRKSVELDPECATWILNNGLILRRLRQDHNGKEYKEELECFEKAVELENSLANLLYLAQAFQEISKYVRSNRCPDLSTETAHDMERKAVDMLRECWNLKNDTAAICRRVGCALMKIRPDLTDTALAKEALLKAVELAPIELTYHALGRFYYNLEKDDEKALEIFAKAKKYFEGTGEIVRLKLIKDPDYDPYDIIQEWIKALPKSVVNNDIMHCDIAWYFLFFKRDLEKSVKYFWEILKDDFKSPRVMKFNSYPFCVWYPLNMVVILVNEIMLLRERNNCLPAESRRNISFLESFLEKMFEKHSELKDYRAKPNVMNNVRKRVEDEINTLRFKRYGHSVRPGTLGGDVKNHQSSFGGRQEMRNNRDAASNRFDSYRESLANNADTRRRSYSNNRYDVEIVNWRTEKRTQ